ncbi:MAG: hypothetical protein SFU83_02580 [Meiothermus sp.]|nr:hypothetical protein [Meiothermus sp.]
MRDRRFVAAHRSGPLGLEHHRLLMAWAYACAEHVLPLLGEPVDERLRAALETARAWECGKARVGAAQKASLAAHAVARALTNPAAVMVARAIGQAVATAHAADHSLGAAEYALKAVKAAGGSAQEERAWQDAQLPGEVAELVQSARAAIRAKAPKFVV